MSNNIYDEYNSFIDFADVDIRNWVESSNKNPVLYRDRQVTEIVLTAIGLSPNLQETLVLKGGTLMALAFKSNRVTGDVDFSAQAEPEGFDQILKSELDRLLPTTAIKLGYLDIICRVQTIKKMPRSLHFADHDFPALLVRIASAHKGTGEEKRFAAGQSIRVLDIEISFRDQVYAFQNLNLTDAGVAVKAFTKHEIIAEKFRELLQQPIRNRYRRQDVYDIAFLLDQHDPTDDDRFLIHKTLLEKCATRAIFPDDKSLEDPEVIHRAQADWDSLSLEIADLPKFGERFSIVAALYRSLPWKN